MNQDQPGLTLDESIKQVMKSLPPVIRNYLAQGKYTAVAKGMMAKYGLRIDQGGVLEREIMLLLMGIENPDEFTKALAEEAKLDQKTIDSIVQDVNAQIFIPLRKEEEEQSKKPAVPVVPSKPVAPASPAAPKSAAPNQSGSYFHLENRIPVTPAPALPKPVMPPAPRPAVASSVGGPRPSSNIAPLPPKFMSPRPSVGGNQKLLEDHEEPHIDIRDKVQGVRSSLPPPPNLPGALPPLKPSTLPLTPSAKPYSGDPYREPIDEK